MHFFNFLTVCFCKFSKVFPVICVFQSRTNVCIYKSKTKCMYCRSIVVEQISGHPYDNFQKMEVYIDFSSKFLRDSPASGASPLNPLQMDISNFFEILPKFSRKIWYTFAKILDKMANFLSKCTFSIAFVMDFQHFSGPPTLRPS